MYCTCWCSLVPRPPFSLGGGSGNETNAGGAEGAGFAISGDGQLFVFCYYGLIIVFLAMTVSNVKTSGL